MRYTATGLMWCWTHRKSFRRRYRPTHRSHCIIAPLSGTGLSHLHREANKPQRRPTSDDFSVPL